MSLQDDLDQMRAMPDNHEKVRRMGNILKRYPDMPLEERERLEDEYVELSGRLTRTETF